MEICGSDSLRISDEAANDALRVADDDRWLGVAVPRAECGVVEDAVVLFGVGILDLLCDFVSGGTGGGGSGSGLSD